jgi:hypothetical protein
MPRENCRDVLNAIFAVPMRKPDLVGEACGAEMVERGRDLKGQEEWEGVYY